MMMYFRNGALMALVGFGFWVNHIWNQNKELRAENALMVEQNEKTAANLKLVVQQLDRETEYRQIAESALQNLSDEVPDVVYSQALPPEIQDVLDRFHERVRP